jgi:glutathione S-transferase
LSVCRRVNPAELLVGEGREHQAPRIARAGLLVPDPQQPWLELEADDALDPARPVSKTERFAPSAWPLARYQIAGICEPDEQIAIMKRDFSERQIGRLHVVGSNDTTAPVIEDSYRRFLGCLNEHLKHYPFLLGRRPGSGDFACYGQLTQLVQFDPTPSAFAARQYPRVHAWVSKMEDLSGLEPGTDDFVDADALPDTLKALLGEKG